MSRTMDEASDGWSLLLGGEIGQRAATAPRIGRWSWRRGAGLPDFDAERADRIGLQEESDRSGG